MVGDHIADLEIVFNILRNYNMKYNSMKCAFGVSSSNFLGPIVSYRGIEANPGQVKALLGITEPKTAKKT